MEFAVKYCRIPRCADNGSLLLKHHVSFNEYRNPVTWPLGPLVPDPTLLGSGKPELLLAYGHVVDEYLVSWVWIHISLI